MNGDNHEPQRDISSINMPQDSKMSSDESSRVDIPSVDVVPIAGSSRSTNSTTVTTLYDEHLHFCSVVVAVAASLTPIRDKFN